MCAQALDRGFLGGWSRRDTLKPGTVIDRYGAERSILLPARVSARCAGGSIAPAFGQPRLGVQHVTDLPVADLIEQGFLKGLG